VVRFQDIIRQTGVTERQLRYLIAEGFVPPPSGGRATAQYGEEHVAAVVRYARLKELGFPPAAIRRLLEAGAGVPIPVAEGLTLVVDASRLASGADVEPLIDEIRRALARALRGTGTGITEE
jgi:MerR family copper efflux transcriptional regulator